MNRARGLRRAVEWRRYDRRCAQLGAEAMHGQAPWRLSSRLDGNPPARYLGRWTEATLAAIRAEAMADAAELRELAE